ncbi:hypothetical protein BH23PSE1_BH23PSE1_13890 [soil metagenome]
MPFRARSRIAAAIACLALVLPVRADPGAEPGQAAARFEDWTLRCADGCTLRTAVVSAGAPADLLEARLAAGRDHLVLATPLPLYLPDPLELGLGEAAPRALPWLTCGPDGCEVRVPLDAALLADLRRERQAAVAFTLLDGTRVRLEVSLMGFTAGERALRAAE